MASQLYSIFCWTNVSLALNVAPLAPSPKRLYRFSSRTFIMKPGCGILAARLTFCFSFRSHGRSTISSATKKGKIIPLRMGYAAPRNAGFPMRDRKLWGKIYGARSLEEKCIELIKSEPFGPSNTTERLAGYSIEHPRIDEATRK